MRKFVLAVCCMTLAAGTVFAAPAPKTASSKATRIGVGFNTQFSQAPGLSARAWLSDTLGIEGVLGFTSGDQNSSVALGGKVLSSLKKEQNLNLYGFGLLGFESVSKIGGASVSETDVTIGGGVGAEFFLQGLPNLGFGTEIGIRYGGITGFKQFSTSADWLTNVGVRYYFQ